jgi:hypothetical protein
VIAVIDRSSRLARRPWAVLLAALAALVAAPLRAEADARAGHPPDLTLRPGLLLAVAGAPKGDGAAKPRASEPGSLDFDLLGAAEPPPDAADAGALRLRRRMLTAHQALGIGLVGLHLGTTVVGQLNYSDKFSSGPNTGRYRLSHAALAYSTLGVFAVNGALALFAPSPVKQPMKLDRVMVHRISMATATAGMLAQAGLGIYTSGREGYLNQERLGQVHLAIGYVTLAALATGVGALVF